MKTEKKFRFRLLAPQKSVDTWIGWGVPAERCQVVHPGDVIKIKDIEIVCLDSFDRTCIVTTDKTGPDREELTGVCPTDMDEKAVNYLVKLPEEIYIIQVIHISPFILQSMERIMILMWLLDPLVKIQWACRIR